MLSFTMNVKNEISLQDNERNMEMIELSAFIRNNGKYDNSKIVLSTENNKVAKHIYVLIKKIFNVVANIDDKNNSFNRSRLLLIEINQKVDNIFTFNLNYPLSIIKSTLKINKNFDCLVHSSTDVFYLPMFVNIVRDADKIDILVHK